MNAFKKKKISVETLGEYLQDARLAHRMDILQVSRLTQIPPKFLESLEEGNYDALPADVYIKGFIKSLAGVYQVPWEPLLQQFEKERGVDRSIKKNSLRPEPTSRLNSSRIMISPRSITFFSVIFLVGIAILYLVWQIRSVSTPPNLELFYPQEDIAITSRNILLRGQTDLDSRVYVNGQEILVGDNGEFQKVLNLSEGTNSLEIEADNKFNKKTTLERTIVVSAPKDATTTTPTVSEEAIEVRLVIGPQSSWVRVESDGEIVHEGEIEAGQEMVFDAQNILILTTGNAGMTRVIYNGQDLGLLGRAGEVISDVRFTAE